MEFDAEYVEDCLRRHNERCEMVRFVGGIPSTEVENSGVIPQGYYRDWITDYWIPNGVILP